MTVETKGKPTRVKHGSISLPLYPHAEGWRWAWKDPLTGRWRYGTRRKRAEALACAFDQAVRLSQSTTDLDAVLADPESLGLIRRALQVQLTHADLERLDEARTLFGDPATADLVRRVVAMGVTHADLDRLADFKQAEVHPLGEVLDQFLAAKESARGLSSRNVGFLRTQTNSLLAHFGADRPIGEITVPEIEAWINSGKVVARTRKNRRGAIITIWRWARSRRYLPDETTAAEHAEKPLVTRGVPTTWTRAELEAMAEVCPPSHLPWLLLSAWAGLRGEEMYQDDRKSDKDVLRWRDVSGGHLEIRPEVAKTGRRRIIEMRPALAAFLSEERARRADEPDSAPVCRGRHASRDLPVLNRSATSICGEAVGGWKQNALRHSFISYRAVQIGLARTAMEAGNSESEAKRSYHDAMTEQQAAAWFAPFGSSSEVAIHQESPKVVAIR